MEDVTQTYIFAASIEVLPLSDFTGLRTGQALGFLKSGKVLQGVEVLPIVSMIPKR